MQSKTRGTEKRIAPRTRRACVEPMAIDAWAHGPTTGLFDVYSGSNPEPYVVDLREGRCTCPDAEHNLADDEACKHERRVALALGLLDVPGELRDEIDATLRCTRRKFGAEPEPVEPEPEVEPVTVASIEAKPDRAVATDGGRVLEAKGRGSGAEDTDAGALGCVCEVSDDLPCFEHHLEGYEDAAVVREEAGR